MAKVIGTVIDADEEEEKAFIGNICIYGIKEIEALLKKVEDVILAVKKAILV